MARAGLDRAAVLEAAAQLADRDGLDRLTLAAVARALGVRSPSLYEHIAGAADLRRGLTLHAVAQLAGDLSRAAAGRSGEPALRAVADAYRAYARSHPGMYAALQSAPDRADAELVAATDAPIETIVAVLRGYGLDGDAAIHGVRLVRCALHGFVSLELVGAFGLPLSTEATWERVVAMLHAGLVPATARRDEAVAATS